MRVDCFYKILSIIFVADGIYTDYAGKQIFSLNGFYTFFDIISQSD